MTPTIEKVRELYHLAENTESDKRAERTYEELEGMLPQSLYDALSEIALRGDVDGAAFEQTFRDYYNKPAETQPESADDEDYDLLPFDLYDNRLKRAVPATGYEIDKWDRPHGSGGQRRKRGPLSKQRFWRRKGKGGTPKFFHGYRMTINGKRKWITDKSLTFGRFNAERKRDGKDCEF